MQDIEALTERILFLGNGRILLDGSLDELKRRTSGHKTLVVTYAGAAPQVYEDSMEIVEEKDGRMVIRLDPDVLPVSDAIARLASRSDILDVTVSGISAEEMVAALYEEYRE